MANFFEPYVRQWLANTDAKTEAEKRAARAARFGIKPDERVIVFRNAGGHVRLALEDIVVIDALIGQGMKELLIVHHTDCGCSHFRATEVKADIIAR